VCEPRWRFGVLRTRLCPFLPSIDGNFLVLKYIRRQDGRMYIGRVAAFCGICLLITATFLTIGLAKAEASQTDGTWRVDNLVLRIFDCQEQVCGRIAWIKEAAKRPSQCGQTIIWGLAPSAQNEWTGGAILDPNDGKTYSLSASFRPDGTLHARIFQGTPLLGRTKILSRVNIGDFEGQC
jgi:uncharacterized protein (DUF2147 family)